MVEVMKIILTFFQRSHAPMATFSAFNPAVGRHRPTHPTRDSSTLTGKSGSVSCGVTAPFSWVLVLTRFCLCLSKVHFPVQCKFWQLSGGLMVTSFKRAYAVPRSTAPRAPAPAAVHCCPIPSQETLTVLP